MESRLSTGKVPAALLSELLRVGGASAPELRIGPKVGEDACAIDVEAGTLVAATDPITLTGRGLGAHAVVINANDVAVMGVSPKWFLSVILLPPDSRTDDLRELFAEMRAALEGVGAVLVGGHTEVTEAVTQPLVVGQMLGITQGRVVATGGGRVGDVVLQVGPAPVEGAAVLAAERPDALRELDPATVARARDAIRDPGISVVAPAILAAKLGATSLHDPTEGGLATGLHELAEACGAAVVVDADAALWFEPGLAICRAVDADPWCTLASGALLACFRAEDAEPARRALIGSGVETAVLGRIEAGAGAATTSGLALPRSERDEVARVLAEGVGERPADAPAT